MRKYLFLGDSITDSDHSFDPENLGYGYVRMIHETLHASGQNYQIINRGFDGFTLPALKRLWKRDAGSLDMDILTILIGINDIGVIHNTGPDPEFALAEFKTRYRRLLEDIRSTYAGPIILMEPFLFPWPERYLLRFDTLRKMNEIIASVAMEYHLTFIPLWDMLMEKARESGYDAVTTDGIHLTEIGHQLIAEKWLDYFDHLKMPRHS